MILDFLIASLAVYRLALLFSDDDGPYGMFRKLRGFLTRKAKTNAAVRKSEIQKGIACQRCSSVWMALPVAAHAFYRTTAGDVLCLILALSAAAILWHRAFPERG